MPRQSARNRIDSLPDDASWRPEDGGPRVHPLGVRVLDRVLAIQRPVVVAHLRSIRLRHPRATTADIVTMLERRYLAAVTTGGAAVGATAVVPGIGTATTLALSGVETAGFLEATALYAQSLSELHGIPVDDPDRARALVLALMLGDEGADLVGQFARQATGRSGARSAYWGEVVTASLPRAAVGPVLDRLTSAFLRRFAATGSASVLGKALPFGIGAAVGGAGNHLLGRRVIAASRRAFGVVPLAYPRELEPGAGALPIERATGAVARRVGGVLTDAGRRVGGVLTRRGRGDRRALGDGSPDGASVTAVPDDADGSREP